MAAFDRDASIERQQIHEISLNVARRLRKVLDRNHYIPAALRSEVESTVRVITGIQRDIDQIMGALPTDEALDFAILTHILGGQRHALDLLEILEEKLEGGRGVYQRDSARVHQALLAISREIEQDAQRSTTDAPAVYPAAAMERRGPARPPDAAAPRSPVGRGAPPATAPPARKPRKPSRPRPGLGMDIRATLQSLATKPVPVALAALTVGVGLTVTVLGIMQQNGDPTPHAIATLAPGEKVGGRLETAAAEPFVPSRSAEPVAVIPPNMDQPYLVVLTTRRSTEELQQDYRAFKSSYPDLLGTAKARVDRVQGQDKQTWYRLSLIPPQTHDDAKTLCRDLKKAGLTGCWIKPVPLR